jgi:hypothetical protein
MANRMFSGILSGDRDEIQSGKVLSLSDKYESAIPEKLSQ